MLKKIYLFFFVFFQFLFFFRLNEGSDKQQIVKKMLQDNLERTIQIDFSEHALTYASFLEAEGFTVSSESIQKHLNQLVGKVLKDQKLLDGQVSIQRVYDLLSVWNNDLSLDREAKCGHSALYGELKRRVVEEKSRSIARLILSDSQQESSLDSPLSYKGLQQSVEESLKKPERKPGQSRFYKGFVDYVNKMVKDYDQHIFDYVWAFAL